ncbi:hypothetical protein CkaCkLH20_01324 [Colletotrichum karsti]|uniref:Uncharacterized protein n=1 Tax=Colletotrichum karsti TaxID=1095194 RepID=A0A9P6LM65_9PEZI|nr:uncharacterized protein CkaCkLH20_01324 [Colletotrichum karsti]KAF9881174.1 hypothetical protein CkaCkLH20_01324 [Colletotrichum karsti]
MKFFGLVSGLLILAPAVHGAWCTPYGISTGARCATGRNQFCCDGPGDRENTIFRGDCVRTGGTCGDGSVSYGDSVAS